MAKIVKPDLTYQWASAAGGGSVAPSSGLYSSIYSTNWPVLTLDFQTVYTTDDKRFP